MPLVWRVFAVNALVLVAAAGALVLTPATVSFPVALTEAAVLAAGLVAVLAVDLLLLRRVFGPLRRLAQHMRQVDPLSPGARVPVEAADPELADLTRAFNEMMDRVETERRDSARRALSAQERERLRIARELHDEVGQRLTAVILRLGRAPASPEEDVGLADAREEVRAVLEEVRDIGRGLRPEALDDLGLAPALRSLCSRIEAATPLLVERRIATPRGLAPETELVIYRVAQEALTNAARHAGARSILVELRTGDDGVLLEVADDGRGIGPERHDGSGIRGMRERALLAGGRLEIWSPAGGGTRVRLRVGAARSSP